MDKQLAAFRWRLRSDVGLSAQEAERVATLVAEEIRSLPVEAKEEIKAASPVELSARFDELAAFQQWSDFARSIPDNPAVTRAAVIVQNYVCFVYLKDACFEVVARRAAPTSVAARTAKYLSQGVVRDFRNAFAHANWCYNSTFSGLDCWVREDVRNRSAPLRYFEVSQADVNFWQALARGVAYSIYTELIASGNTR